MTLAARRGGNRPPFRVRGLFGDLDREALTAIGIDVEAVRACVEASFGQEALRQADQAVGREAGAFSWSPRRRSGAWRDGVFLPHGPGAEQALRNARREAQVRHAPQVTLEDLAIGLLAVSEGLVPRHPVGARRTCAGIARRDRGPLPAGELGRVL